MHNFFRLLRGIVSMLLGMVIIWGWAIPAQASNSLTAGGSSISWDPSTFYEPSGCTQYRFSYTLDYSVNFATVKISNRFGDTLGSSFLSGSSGNEDMQICGFQYDAAEGPFKLVLNSSARSAYGGNSTIRESSISFLSRDGGGSTPPSPPEPQPQPAPDSESSIPAFGDGLEPKLGSIRSSKVESPSQPPTALEKLSPRILESVVTILCEDGRGSGWSADVNISPVHSSQGMNSFIVTNEHVISSCQESKTVTVVTDEGVQVAGTVVSWDEENDLAGIITGADLPGLTWWGERPAQGWWAGVLGNPRGFTGYLTTGLISTISSDESEIGTTSPLNPGNSGGPIFDREGRVIGTVSWKLLQSEGLGFAKAAPLLCQKIVDCESQAIWSDREEESLDRSEETQPESSEAAGTDKKLNAGSFKGYVALYAKGYKGERLSAKVGKDWVIRPRLEEDFVRIVEFTGAGYTIDVRLYINSALAKTITITTK